MLSLTGLAGAKAVNLRMPRLTPGDYRIRDYARGVLGFMAFAEPGRRPLPVSRVGSETWKVNVRHAARISVRYVLLNSVGDMFTDNVVVRDRYAFYNGAAVFLMVDGHRGTPCRLTVMPPRGWRGTICALGAPGRKTHTKPSANELEAPDYDTLVDSPVLVGDRDERTFTTAGRPHTVAFFGGRRPAEYSAVTDGLRSIVTAASAVFGSVPYRRYVFLVDVNGTGGGLEHAASTRIAWARNDTPRGLLWLAAHEYLHVWNVKRICPAAFVPLDYGKPQRTRTLWFLEGVTDYYARIVMRQAGLIGEADFLGTMAATIAALEATPARRSVTANESSWRVWEARNSMGYGGLSYYVKGDVIGMCLDLAILRATAGKASLDDVMRDLLRRYGSSKRGYPEDALRAAVVRIGGQSLGDLYDRASASTSELPVDECLAWAGMRRVRNGGTIVSIDGAAATALTVQHAWLRRSDGVSNRAARSRAISSSCPHSREPWAQSCQVVADRPGCQRSVTAHQSMEWISAWLRTSRSGMQGISNRLPSTSTSSRWLSENQSAFSCRFCVTKSRGPRLVSTLQ